MAITGLAFTGNGGGRTLGDIRLRFDAGEFAGKTGRVISIIPMRYRKCEITYRIQIDGFPTPGGWDGLAIMTAKSVAELCTEIISTNPK